MYFRAISGMKQFGGAENPVRDNKCKQSNDNTVRPYHLLKFKKGAVLSTYMLFIVVNRE